MIKPIEHALDLLSDITLLIQMSKVKCAEEQFLTSLFSFCLSRTVSSIWIFLKTGCNLETRIIFSHCLVLVSVYRHFVASVQSSYI